MVVRSIQRQLWLQDSRLAAAPAVINVGWVNVIDGYMLYALNAIIVNHLFKYSNGPTNYCCLQFEARQRVVRDQVFARAHPSDLPLLVI